jgi:hypothetical protein
MLVSGEQVHGAYVLAGSALLMREKKGANAPGWEVSVHMAL